MSLGDLVLNIGKLIKEYEDNTPAFIEEKVDDDLYSINQVVDMYPLLSKHILTNAINNGELNVTWIGNKRYFNLKDIDDYLKAKEEKVENKIPKNLNSWRNNS